MAENVTERYNRAKVQGAMDLAVKVAMPFLISVCGWTFVQLWSHENRLTRIEARDEGVGEDLREIKQDVQKLVQFHMKDTR